MSTVRRLAALLGVSALAACAGLPGAPQPLGTEAVGPGYAAGGGQYDDGAAVIVLVRTFEHQGRVGFCGARTGQAMTTRTMFHNDFVADAMILRLGGDRIRQGLEMLPEAAYADDMTGAAARCYVTAHAWRPAYADAEPTIRAPRMQFDMDEEDGQVVTFRGAPVARPLP